MEMQGQQNVVTGEMREWNVSCKQCCYDGKTCCCVFCFPCCVACGTARKLGEMHCNCCLGYACFPGSVAMLRQKLRMMYGIQGSVCKDLCLTTFCLQCILCQLENELSSLGIR